MTDTSKIRDNPSAKELAETVQGMTTLSKMVQFLEKLGIRNQAISDAFQRLPALAIDTDKLINLPDRFNDRFRDRGWIAFESMNVEVMHKAIEMADSDSEEAAENLLAAHFDEETIRFHLVRLKAISQFQPRWPLAIKALEDYLAGRFHACVPVVLSMIDGFVNDIEQTGFFAAGTDLTAWDSIAAHSSGLTRLRDIFSASRKKTTTVEITLPYRHGILHGRDIGYDNELVAAKTWAALFAVGDWAFAIRAGKKNPQPKPPEPSLLESLRKLSRTQAMKRQLETWSPRSLTADIDYPSVGTLHEYSEGTPEHTIALFFDFWNRKNYGHMAKLLKTFCDIPAGKAAGSVREDFGDKEFRSFCIVEVQDVAPAASEIKVRVQFQLDADDKEEEIDVRLIYEDENGDPVVFPQADGAWRIMPYAFNPIIHRI